MSTYLLVPSYTICSFDNAILLIHTQIDLPDPLFIKFMSYYLFYSPPHLFRTIKVFPISILQIVVEQLYGTYFSHKSLTLYLTIFSITRVTCVGGTISSSSRNEFIRSIHVPFL
jgi:hypothetical protein